MKKKGKKTSDYYPFKKEELKYWIAFSKVLKELLEHQELKISQVEMAAALDVDRAYLVKFLELSEFSEKQEIDKIPVDGSHIIRRGRIINLFNYLNASEQEEAFQKINPDKHEQILGKKRQIKITTDIAEKRKKILEKKGGLDWLLKTAGLQTNSSSMYQHQNILIHRIISRLSSKAIKGDILSLTDNIVERILEDGYLKEQNSNYQQSFDYTKAIKYYDSLSDNQDSDKDEIFGKYEKALKKWVEAGKTTFNHKELFELYYIICENHSRLEKLDPKFNIRIISCQFRTFSISVDIYAFEQQIKDQIETCGKMFAKKLRNSEKDENLTEKDTDNNPVIEATVVNNFRHGEQDINFRYISSSTHTENMLLAIKHGLGHYQLKMADLSIKALGLESGSLAKISVSFHKGLEKYYGIWIDQNMILGMLQSVVLALTNWLSASFQDSSENYLDWCQKNSELDERLYRVRNGLNECLSRGRDFSHLPKYDNLFKECENLIQTIKTKQDELKKSKNNSLKECFQESLAKKYWLTTLSYIRLCHIYGDCNTALSELSNLEDSELFKTKENNKSGECDKIPIRILYDIEMSISDLISGNEQYLVGRQWRLEDKNILTQSRKTLNDYIKKQGVIDLNYYICISEVLGSIARLEFYTCNSDEQKYLKEAIEYFLAAAYFSLKLGHHHRVANWLVQAGRCYCRLGLKDEAKKYAVAAEEVLDRAINKDFSENYKQGMFSEIYILKAEIWLAFRAINQNSEDVDIIENLIKALNGTIYLNFVRLIADVLYDLSRVIRELEIKTWEDFEPKFPDVKNKIENLLKMEENWQSQEMTQTIVERLKDIINKNNNCLSVAQFFNEQAQWIWNQWYLAKNPEAKTKKHPFAEKISEYDFLVFFDLDNS